MSNPTLEEALAHQSRRSHEIQTVITHFFLQLTARMNCSMSEIAEGLVGTTAHYIAVAAMPNERAEVADRMCAEIQRRVTKR